MPHKGKGPPAGGADEPKELHSFEGECFQNSRPETVLQEPRPAACILGVDPGTKSGAYAFLFPEHGLSRFVPAWETSGLDQKIINLAGFRKRAGEDEDSWDFYITSEAWPEVAAGFNKVALPKTLLKATSLRIPGHGKRRIYHISHISHKIFDGGDNNGWSKPYVAHERTL